jgi:multiple sugar transport system substrate-binding protein/sn-glycerol 3-phosphate transport system substrate-binding protein
MRKNLLLAFLLMLVLSAGVVGAQDDLSGVDPSGATVVYWHQYNDGPQLETMTAMIEEFNSSNEWGITVEGLPQGSYGDIRELMSAAIISGETPNLVAGFQNDAASYALDGMVVDLNAYYDDPTWGFTEEEKADLNQDILNVDVFNVEPFAGARLAWPNQTSALVLAVNLTMLEALGFGGPPETFEDFQAVACAAAEMTGPNGENVQGFPISTDSSHFESLVASMGGSIFDGQQYTFTSPEVVATFQMLQDLYNDGCAYIPESAFGNTDDFALGLNPMATTSTAGIPFIRGGIEESGIEADWIVTTTPWSEGNRTIQVFVPSIIPVVSTPEQQLASWLFLKYISGAEQQAQWTSNTSYFPIRHSAGDMLGDFESENPFYAAASALLNDESVNVYAGPQVLSYGSVRGMVSEAIANVTANGMDVTEAATALEEAANAAQAGE